MSDPFTETLDMRCMEIIRPGAPDVLKLAERPTPKPSDQEVLIRVAAAGVNRPDIIQRQGSYPPPPGASDIPGLEVAGEIVACGEDVCRWRPGDRVCALIPGGGYAEYATAHHLCCLPIPDDLPIQEAAALPETFFTVWSNLFDRARLQAGETLLVHGGAGGIGNTAIAMASALGVRVFTTAGSDEKCAICRQLGAEYAFNYREEDFVAGVKDRTDGKGVNVILDMVGGDYIQRNIKAAAFRGRIVNIAFLQGSKATVDLMPVMLKQLVLTGSTLRSRPDAEKADIARNLERRIWPLLKAGRLRPRIFAAYPLEQAATAHAQMESFRHNGKIVLITQ